MNRSIRALLTVACAILAILALSGFTDMSEDHWSWPAVNRLVQEGTISGYEDGSFQPDALVTRAELVKMLGYQTESVRTDYVEDLTWRHWAYKYLLHSPLRLIDRKILPDQAITREQVALYMYDCYANGGSHTAPSVITRGLYNPNEVGWVYEHGIMVGDDGLDLRLEDGLSRAEAAVLVANSRDKLGGIYGVLDNVPESALEAVFNNSGLFDAEYDPDAVLTTGEVARAAYRLRSGRVFSLWYDEEADFEHKYANDLKAMEQVLGSGRISAKLADEPAQPEDAYAMMAYGVASKIKVPVGYGARDEYYKDAKLADPALSIPLTFAYRNGIRPYPGDVLKTGTPVTHKVMAGVLIQYDRLWGIMTSMAVESGGITEKDEKMRFIGLPENAELFQAVLDGVPNAVYEMPFRTAKGEEIQDVSLPKLNYGFYFDLRSLFAEQLTAQVESLKSRGAEVRLTYYPQLAYDNGSGITIRVKAELLNDGPGLTAAELFPGQAVYADSAEPLTQGSTAWTEYTLDYMFFAT